MASGRGDRGPDLQWSERERFGIWIDIDFSASVESCELWSYYCALLPIAPAQLVLLN